MSPSLTKMPSDLEESKQNPVLLFFKEKEKNKIEVSPHEDVNTNITELRRMVSKMHTIPSDEKQN